MVYIYDLYYMYDSMWTNNSHYNYMYDIYNTTTPIVQLFYQQKWNIPRSVIIAFRVSQIWLYPCRSTGLGVIPPNTTYGDGNCQMKHCHEKGQRIQGVNEVDREL